MLLLTISSSASSLASSALRASLAFSSNRRFRWVSVSTERIFFIGLISLAMLIVVDGPEPLRAQLRDLVLRSQVLTPWIAGVGAVDPDVPQRETLRQLLAAEEAKLNELERTQRTASE